MPSPPSNLARALPNTNGRTLAALVSLRTDMQRRPPPPTGPPVVSIQDEQTELHTLKRKLSSKLSTRPKRHSAVSDHASTASSWSSSPLSKAPPPPRSAPSDYTLTTFLPSDPWAGLPSYATGGLSSLGGIDNICQTIQQLVIRPLRHPEVFHHLGVECTRGVLLHGPPGAGKTTIAHAIAAEANRPFFSVAATELISGVSGESEALLRSLFEAAKAEAPSVVFIDEIDAITPKRDTAAREMERRIVAQLGASMDALAGTFVVVLGATNRVEALDPMIRRNGRFDRELAIPIPDEASRCQMLKSMCSTMKLSAEIDFSAIAKLTPGFVGADIQAVTREAALLAMTRVFDQLEEPDQTKGEPAKAAAAADGDAIQEAKAWAAAAAVSSGKLSVEQTHNSRGREFTSVRGAYTREELGQFDIREHDFIQAVKQVQPSARREGFSTIPEFTWNDVGALQDLRRELVRRICNPIKQEVLYRRLGLGTPAGVLLYGPPGCGKTLLAKAVANESGANFISVKGPELLNKYVGESEKAVRELFQRARVSSPCIIFFDELDSLCSKRSAEGTQSAERVVNQLLTEMDGVEERKNVFVVAATNRPDIIDPAMLRPGRLDRLLYVPLPDKEERLDILRTLCRGKPLDEDVDMSRLSEMTEGYTGADLAAVLREATMAALERCVDTVNGEPANSVNTSDWSEPTPQGEPSRCVNTPDSTDAMSAVGNNISVRMVELAAAVQKIPMSVSKKQRDFYVALQANYTRVGTC
eukprot:GHVS01061387.1.p1 GENE.GHVS01061387.1~~GHVS01061387.1.p1  ORF type:complete len:757 (+),score=145.70 GHVS01061387.1:190-2460(+)